MMNLEVIFSSCFVCNDQSCNTEVHLSKLLVSERNQYEIIRLTWAVLNGLRDRT